MVFASLSVRESPLQKWEYLNVRYDFLGRGITQEFQKLNINGKKVDAFQNTLLELLNELGEEGWELICHSALDDANLVTWHYLFLKRPLA